MKRILTIITSLLAVATATAQGFDWTESFGSSIADINRVRFMDTDSAGFIYIAGECGTNAEIAGTRLLDMTPYGQYANTTCCFVAKLDPADGHVIWRKAIHQNEGSHTVCNYMQFVGDSAVVLSVNYVPAGFRRYLWYLDTLITAVSSFPNYPFRYFEGSEGGTGFIWLNTDGDLMEHHYLQLGYLDTAGRGVTAYPHLNRPMEFDGVSGNPFYVGNDGSIYILRNTTDLAGVFLYDSIEHQYTFTYYSFPGGQLKTIRILVDVDRGSFDYAPDGDGELLGYSNRMILKFSPHFDSLLWVNYILKDTVPEHMDDAFTMKFLHEALSGDDEGDIYLTGTIEPLDYPDDFHWQQTFLLDTVLNEKSITMTPYQKAVGFAAKYHPDGDVAWVTTIQGNVVNETNEEQGRSGILNLFIDDTSVYLLAGANRPDTSYHYTVSDSVVFDEIIGHRSRICFLKCSRDDGSYQHYGVTRSGVATSEGYYSSIVARNGRIFAQVNYQGNIQSIDSSYHLEYVWQWGQALVQWDELGHCVKVMPHDGATGGDSGPICIHNDIIYGSGTVDEGAYIYKYTDSSLLTPYHARRDQRIHWDQHLTLSVDDGYVRLSAVASSGLPVSYSVDDTAIATLHGDTLFLTQAGTTTLRASQPGNEDWYPAEDVTRTLLVSTRASQRILWNQSLHADMETTYIVLNATATSGLPVSYSVDDTAIATLHGDTLFIQERGYTVVRANQIGNDDYLPAAEAAKRLTVTNVGIGDDAGIASVSVYPNPAEGLLTVSTAVPVRSILLVNMLGQTVLTHSPTGSITTLEVSHIERGAYFLRLIGDNDVTTRKVILK